MFIHFPRTGGTYIKAKLRQPDFCLMGDESPGAEGYRDVYEYQHPAYGHAKQLFIERSDLWNAGMWTVVRNPYDWNMSYWSWMYSDRMAFEDYAKALPHQLDPPKVHLRMKQGEKTKYALWHQKNAKEGFMFYRWWVQFGGTLKPPDVTIYRFEDGISNILKRVTGKSYNGERQNTSVRDAHYTKQLAEAVYYKEKPMFNAFGYDIDSWEQWS